MNHDPPNAADPAPDPAPTPPGRPRRLLILEDARARRWVPFSPTRPVSELLFGTVLLRERIEEAAGLPAEAILGAPELAGFSEPGTPPVLQATG
ncbi:MAG: hypothetical protein EA352_12770, partial [Gemmatimonadales bacterium]